MMADAQARTAASSTNRRQTASEFHHGGISGAIEMIRLCDIMPSLENDSLYRPVDPNDPDIQALVASIRKFGVREPIIVTMDDVILSGHRRHAAATIAKLKRVPCRRESILSTDPKFLLLLREYNRQRVKSIDEVLREEILAANPEHAYDSLLQYRREAAKVKVKSGTIVGEKHRAAITKAKQPFLDAIKAIIERLKDFWPLSDRLIHYQLLNAPPLIHANKPDSTYANDHRSYDALTELLTRARIAGLVPFEAIHDPTRPVTTWRVFRRQGLLSARSWTSS